MALSGAWLLLLTAGATGQEAPPPQALGEAAQPNAAEVQTLTEFLKAQAARSEEATRLERDVIRHALTVFVWIVGVVGTLLVTGAGVLGWMLSAWSRANIHEEVGKQLQAAITASVEAEIKKTRERVASLADEAEEVSKQLSDAKSRVAGTEGQLKEQSENLMKLYALALGSYPYSYLKSIHDKKKGIDPNQEFKLQPGDSFRREMNFLIDLGFLENVNLSMFQENSNILDKLIITEAGENYVNTRERYFPRKPETEDQPKRAA